MSISIKLFTYLLSLILILILLFSIFIFITSSYGGLKLNFLERSISDQIKSSLLLNIEFENIILRIDRGKGFYIELKNTIITNENLLEVKSDTLNWDFNLISLLTFSIDKNNKISSDNIIISNADFKILITDLNTDFDNFNKIKVSMKKIKLETNFNDLNILLSDTILSSSTSSIADLLNSKLNIKSILSINDENYSTEAEYYREKDRYIVNIYDLSNDKIILIKGSFIKLSNDLSDANINLVTSIGKDAAISFLQTSILSRESNTGRVTKFLDENLNNMNDVILNFNINPKSKDIFNSLRDLYVVSSGKLNLDIILDDNDNPNYVSGQVQYYLEIQNLETSSPILKGQIDLSDTTAFIRQINLKKNKTASLKIQFKGDTNSFNDSIITFDSLDSEIDFEGKIKITKTNHIFLENLFIDNKSNVNFQLSGDLSERILNLEVTGKTIDLSQNKVETKNVDKDYYLSKENYSIITDNVIFAGPVKVNDFKAVINKKGQNLSVSSRAFFNGHDLNYSREKNKMQDVNIIKSSDITHFVNNNHLAKKLLSDGEFEMVSARNLFTQEANVNISLKDFVLINTPASLKILSLPSISGLVSIAEGEQGIRFGYGEINYLETENKFNEIEAYAVSDSLGLIMEGYIDRKKETVDMQGEISPMHLVNAIIQKLPILGPLIVGGEGEGMFSIDFSMEGPVDNPEVDSNPLTIIKPRIIERAIEALDNSTTIQ